MCYGLEIADDVIIAGTVRQSEGMVGVWRFEGSPIQTYRKTLKTNNILIEVRLLLAV